MPDQWNVIRKTQLVYIIFNIKLKFDKNEKKLKPLKGVMPDQWNVIRKTQPLRADSEHFGMNTALSGLTVIELLMLISKMVRMD